jgi:hypothetical protein
MSRPILPHLCWVASIAGGASYIILRPAEDWIRRFRCVALLPEPVPDEKARPFGVRDGQFPPTLHDVCKADGLRKQKDQGQEPLEREGPTTDDGQTSYS